MKKIVYKSTAIKAIILITAALLVLSVWPLRMWTETKVYGTKPASEEKTPVVNYQNSIMEVFVASDTHLQSISLYVNEGTYTKDFEVELTDGTGKHINTVKVQTPEQLPGYVDIVLDANTVPEELYILKFRSIQSVYLGMEPFDVSSEVLVVPYYNDAPLDGKALILDFEYRVPVSTAKSLLIIGVIILAAAVLWALTDLTLKDKAANGLVTVESVLKNVLNPLAALLLVTCLIFIALGYVSRFAPDNIFAVISVILLGVILFYAINHKRSPATVDPREYIRTHIPDFIQSLGIAYAIQACCEYVSGLYDIHHRVAERKEMIGFAVAIIAMFAFSEIFNLYNLIYVVAALIAGIIYFRANVTAEMTADDRFVIKGNVIIAILLGLILIRTVKGLIQKKCAVPNIVGAGITLIYFILIIVFRNTRWWTVVMAVSFLLLFINYGMWDKKGNFLANVVRGVAIQFIMCTIWCLMYRPFTTFRSARYTHFFHTETITATYMTMVSCVFLVMLISKIRILYLKKDDNDEERSSGKIKLADIWKELILFGVAVSYLLFTFARTAYAATIVAFAAALIAVFAFSGSKGFILGVKTIGWMCAAVIIMIPVTFEFQRTIPALVSNPYEYDIDEDQDDILHGRNLSSPNYMMVGRLYQMFLDKILDMDAEVMDMYYNDDSYPDEYEATMRQLYEMSDGYDWPGLTITDEEWDSRPTNEQFDMYVLRNGEPEEWKYIAQLKSVEEGQKEYAAAVEAENEANPEPEPDYSNGRMDIYRSYIEQMNMTGHDSMGAILSDGEPASHAHDVYLQVAFDHGIPTGIVFLLFGLTMFVLSIIYHKKSDDRYEVLPMTIIIAFAVAGLVEWVFHLSHPISYVMLLTMSVLMFFRGESDKKDKAA